LEEVVVTAQRKAESLQDAPISIAAFSSDALEKKGIFNLVDLRANVPNLQMTPHPNSATTARVYLRGVGNNDDQITQDPSVAIYMDGVYLARNLGLAQEVADIERIEVLRGPQ
ncbi:MAG TPA: TonB-dependent receptor, partial [Spongiibacteraceae bacterium]|nr:TonB-dependent receptor [Spongiibacteraceae bacterium]